MKKKEDLTDKTIQALLSGLHPLSKKFGGKQVFVIEKEIVTIGRGKKALDDFKSLKEKYGKPPVVTFIPEPGTSYILLLQ